MSLKSLFLVSLPLILTPFISVTATSAKAVSLNSKPQLSSELLSASHSHNPLLISDRFDRDQDDQWHRDRDDNQWRGDRDDSRWHNNRNYDQWRRDRDEYGGHRDRDDDQWRRDRDEYRGHRDRDSAGIILRLPI